MDTVCPWLAGSESQGQSSAPPAAGAASRAAACLSNRFGFLVLNPKWDSLARRHRVITTQMYAEGSPGWAHNSLLWENAEFGSSKALTRELKTPETDSAA